jgi:hypothetical protein
MTSDKAALAYSNNLGTFILNLSRYLDSLPPGVRDATDVLGVIREIDTALHTVVQNLKSSPFSRTALVHALRLIGLQTGDTISNLLTESESSGD